MGELFLIWLFSILIGGLIGMNKGQEWSGVVWSTLLGPVGVIITLCLPNVVKQKAEADSMKLRAEELQVQKQILAELQRQRSPAATPPPVVRPTPPPPPAHLPPLVEDFIPESLRPISRRR